MSSNRRTFVKTVIASFGGAMTLRQVVAAAAAVGKRPLTNTQFNERFAALRGTAQFRTEVAEAKAGLLPFLEKNFYLRPDQIADIRALPAADIRTLNLALDQAAARNLPIRLAQRADCGRFGHLNTVVTPEAVTIDFVPVAPAPRVR